ncbi:MAG: hypothetical protein QXZ17_03790 [Nitrososphaerota archaeon]
MFKVICNFTRIEGITPNENSRSKNNLISENQRITKIRLTRLKDQFPRLDKLEKVNWRLENNE